MPPATLYGMTFDTHEHTNRCWWSPDQAAWVCQPDPAPQGDQTLVDVRDMIVVHTAMLREFRLAPAAVRRTTPGDRKQARAVTAHLRFVCDMLHHHHAGEDELLWPKLRARTSAAAGAVIDDVEAQHTDIDAALREVTALLDTWAVQPDVGSADQLGAHLDKLHALLRDHLDLEERALLPLAASVLTDTEWHAIGAAAAASMPKPLLALAFGMFAYEGDPAVIATMLQAAPPVPRMLLPRIAPRLYARRCQTIHGTARP